MLITYCIEKTQILKKMYKTGYEGDSNLWFSETRPMTRREPYVEGNRKLAMARIASL